jgi:hypothetical protein
MSHLLIRFISALGRTSAVLALLLAAQTTHAAPIFQVGAKETIYTAGQRSSLGLSFWPDGNMGVAAAGNGNIHFYAANSTSSVRTTGTLTNPGQSKQSVSIYNLKGSYNYLAGGPVYEDPTSGARLMLYHAEKHFGNAQNYYTTLGLAVSRDPAGLQFEDLGLVVEPNIASPMYHSIDLGGGSLSVLNGDLYIHYRDYLANGSSAELASAKAPLATVMANALNRQGTSFTKYYNGAWNQPGRGGLASPLETGNPGNAWSSVAYNSYLNQLVMVSAQMSQTDGGNLFMATSSDGVNWGSRQAIVTDYGEQFYPSLVGTGSDPAKTGSSFYVYYTDSAAGAWNRWNDAKLVRRAITVDPVAAGLPAPTSEWSTVSDFAADFQGGAPAAGWNYLWNPTLTVTNPAQYVPLQWSSAVGAYNTTGAGTQAPANGVGHKDDYLALYSWGGHPGQPGVNAIASYTIQADDGPGAYRIGDSSIMKMDGVASPGEDGLNMLVYVNKAQSGPATWVPVSGATVNFNRDLGQLAVGDTVYVMVNAAGNQSYDSVRGFDFSIQKNLLGGTATAPPVVTPPVVAPPVVAPPVVTQPITPPQPEWTTVADYAAEFRQGTPGAGWKYMWNPTGKLGNAAAFAPLIWSSSVGAYNATGGPMQAPSGGRLHADDYLALGSYGGHPGQPGYNVIAGYTIQAEDGGGMYRLAASTLMKADAIASAGEDGLTLMVYVNNALRGSMMTVPTSGAAITFNRDLGQLLVGDTIYVAIGAATNLSNDSFKNFNFQIQRQWSGGGAYIIQLLPEPTSAVMALAGLAVAAGMRHESRGPRCGFATRRARQWARRSA